MVPPSVCAALLDDVATADAAGVDDDDNDAGLEQPRKPQTTPATIAPLHTASSTNARRI
jgi:hypothetical protein